MRDTLLKNTSTLVFFVVVVLRRVCVTLFMLFERYKCIYQYVVTLGRAASLFERKIPVFLVLARRA